MPPARHRARALHVRWRFHLRVRRSQQLNPRVISMLNFALAITTGALKAQYITTVNQHISEFMPVFQNPHLNGEWNSRMSNQRFLRCPVNGQVVHQQYSLPWPLKPRELLMSCTSAVLHREQAVVSTCHSAHSDLVPVTDEAVRMEIKESNWRLTALPRGRTRILVDLTISEQCEPRAPEQTPRAPAPA